MTMDNTFTVKFLWTTDGMCLPHVTVSLPEDMDPSEREQMLIFIAETAATRKGCKVQCFTNRPCNDHVSITVGTFHFGKVRKNNPTPVPPVVIRWLIRELPKFGVLPPAWRLRFEVSWLNPDTRWLKPDTRVWVIDPSIGGAK